MSQTLVRQIISKSSGLPETGKTTVFARPVWANDLSHDYPMPETPSGSGYYVSTVAIPHDTYKIYVDGAASGEEVTVQPGRVIVGLQGDESTSSPKSLDRIVNNKVMLSMFVADTVASPTHDNVVSAMTFASQKGCVLVFDYDVSPSNDIILGAANLLIDLNGHTLDFSKNVTELSASRLVIENGGVVLKSGEKTLIGTSLLICEKVQFYEDSGFQFLPHNTDFYIGCTGINSFKASRSAGSYDYTVPRIIGGDRPSDVSKLVLGDYNVANIPVVSGKARLVDLQQTVDEELPRLHQLVGKKSSTVPYSDGFFNDTMLATITSLAEASERILASSSVDIEKFSTLLPEGDALPHPNPVGSSAIAMLASVTAPSDGKYEVFGSYGPVGVNASATSAYIFMFKYKVNDVDIGDKYDDDMYDTVLRVNPDASYTHTARLVYDLAKNDILKMYALYYSLSGHGQFFTGYNNLFLRRIGDRG